MSQWGGAKAKFQLSVIDVLQKQMRFLYESVIMHSNQKAFRTHEGG